MIGDAFYIANTLIDRAGRAVSDRDTDALAAIVPQIAASLDLSLALVGDPAQLSCRERAAILHQSSTIIAKMNTIVQLTAEIISVAAAEFNEEIQCLPLPRSNA
ncbi:hypothetical protein [Bosea sp. Root670]|uniref:hypothetical protein n=1 Tax=Bosea sp. Root670 TaxID=1736583 RepID=UPI0012E36A5F|nr:hypothetical protein [Bosea sp. Root670]